MNTEFIRRASRYMGKRKGATGASIGGGLSLAGLVAYGHNLDKQIDGQRAWNVRQSERIAALEKFVNEQDVKIKRVEWEIERMK